MTDESPSARTIAEHMRPVDTALRDRGFSRADLGRELKLDSAQVSRTFSGSRRLQRHEAQQLEAWLGIRVPGAPQSDNGQVLTLSGMVPLYGYAGAAGEDQLTLADSQMLGSVPVHPAQVNLRNAFAVRVHGDSMSPRYEHGEIVYVAPNQWPTRNQDCVIETMESFGYLKRFRRRSDGELVLFQFNPEGELQFELKDVRTMHAVVGRG